MLIQKLIKVACIFISLTESFEVRGREKGKDNGKMGFVYFIDTLKKRIVTYFNQKEV